MLIRKLTQNFVYRLLTTVIFSTLIVFAPVSLANQSISNSEQSSVTEEQEKQHSDENQQLSDSENRLEEDRPDRTAEQQQQLESTRTRLANLMATEQRKELLLVQLLNDRENSDTEDYRKSIDEEIELLRAEINQIRVDFDLTLTGGIDQVKLVADTEESYNWRTDLEEVMRPIFRSMKGITEKPREIERLRSKINFLKRNIELSESALNFIQQLKDSVLPDIFVQRIHDAEKNWTEQLGSLNEELEIVQFQLQTRLDESSNFFNNFGETISDFATGRGLSILLALFAFWAVWFFLSMLRKGYLYILAKKKIDLKYGLASRLLHYAYQIFVFFVAFIAMFLVFYVKGDWIMLGISMLIIAIIVLSIKNYFPKFVIETKLLLNVGPVREGERLVYQGIAWKVDKISVYTDLFNPLLVGGKIRVQMKELVNLNSRPFDDNEEWFPCREGDMLLMPEGRLVKVEIQTPEYVKLNYTGGATTTVNTTDFLSMSFTNLSEESFRVSSYFGIDYGLQKTATTRIQHIFREEIQENIESQNYGKYLKVLRVEFHEAASSALVYKIIADFHGIAARHHNIIARALQSAAVDVCNRHDWSIPFNQLTLHQAEISSVDD